MLPPEKYVVEEVSLAFRFDEIFSATVVGVPHRRATVAEDYGGRTKTAHLEILLPTVRISLPASSNHPGDIDNHTLKCRLHITTRSRGTLRILISGR